MVNSPGSGGGFGPEERSEASQEPALQVPADRAWAERADEFVDAERVRLAAEQRRRQRWQQDRRAEDVTLAAALRSAIGEEVALHLRTGATLRGTLEVSGLDVVAVASPAGLHWVAQWAVAAADLPAPPRDVEVSGWEPTLAEVLDDLRGRGGPLSIVVDGGALVRGEVLVVGEMVTVRDSERRSYQAVALDAIVSFV